MRIEEGGPRASHCVENTSESDTTTTTPPVPTAVKFTSLDSNSEASDVKAGAMDVLWIQLLTYGTAIFNYKKLRKNQLFPT